jgi:hypothetical protein
LLHFSRRLAVTSALVSCLLPATASASGTWTKLKNQPTFGANTMLLLHDGTVLTQDVGTDGLGSGNWWRLTPDKTGSYINGSWSKVASMPSGYGPLYYASQVLPDGRVIVNGGEYDGPGTENGVWTTKGAIFDPVANSWTAVKAPSGWTTIGDAQSTLLADGTYMLANCCTTDEATLNLKTMDWTTTGKKKADINDEEGWALLPSGQILTADANNTADPKHTEILTSGSWASAGDSPVLLADLGTSTNSHELGPLIVRPNGTVFAVGATGYTAIYTIATKTWTQGPSFPKNASSQYYDEADGPASLLPDGNVLLAASPGVYNTPTEFFEFTGTKLVKVAATSNAPNDPSFAIYLMVLPTGQVMATDQSSDVEIYTPTGVPKSSWLPTITKFPSTVTHGETYTISGKRLSGFSQANAYGDDNQSATNYPIVRITNTATGDVAFATTDNCSSYAVANPNVVTASVLIPKSIKTGASTLEVIANGIASKPFSITIK